MLFSDYKVADKIFSFRKLQSEWESKEMVAPRHSTILKSIIILSFLLQSGLSDNDAICDEKGKISIIAKKNGKRIIFEITYENVISYKIVDESENVIENKENIIIENIQQILKNFLK